VLIANHFNQLNATKKF